MKLEFKISKLANLFFFVDNLSEWNIYCRKNYNEEWVNQLGGLNKKEKTTLANYQSLMQKHEKNNLPKKIRNIFYNDGNKEIDNKTRKRVKTLLFTKDSDIVLNAIDVLYLKFQMAWAKYQPILSQNKEIILKSFKDIKNDFNSIFSNLAKFYGKKIRDQSSDVYLIISPIEKYQGGKAIDKNKISIEINKLDYENKNQLIGFWFLVVHEIIHANFEDQKYKEWIKQFIERQPLLKSKIIEKYGTKSILREIITATATTAADLLSATINKEKTNWQKLNEERLKTSNPNDINTLRLLAKNDLRETINQYFEDGRKIDELFLKKCWDLISDYPENLLRESKKKKNNR